MAAPVVKSVALDPTQNQPAPGPDAQEATVDVSLSSSCARSACSGSSLCCGGEGWSAAVPRTTTTFADGISRCLSSVEPLEVTSTSIGPTSRKVDWLL